MSINVLEFLSSLNEREQQDMCKYYKDMIDNFSKIRVGYVKDFSIFMYFNTTDILFVSDFIERNMRNYRRKFSHEEMSCTKCNNGFLFELNLSKLDRTVQGFYTADIDGMCSNGLAEMHSLLYFKTLRLMGEQK